ncbi:mechanosensitive ion channel family protein [Leptospira borgpetersenii]|uniref:mechanosensitive ion channel family protein n=1 Tax=Leptospira borgpetersenii TaxID=174 RepID=UPI00077395AD|nr:mechanosensitive ion channel family protein [Leptospira borgpetersenii]MBE8399014.1 mechanosensitive ion channel family protein [Leptospira borgpetersenii serovar Tarassovi]MBE8402098.1 mechanosensitive ion channel family protein [Leptospira borgpetersenii serovar Tarassovi]MBE8405113.1 mechanosensitive ion channel family protein [Leptospira borgpetersenii serovar Tarassovi]MBE8411416.1 mechanosensitive ion channel family protein [Leptospira borgpetersenii serovar Tarassovi]MBE8414512.1 mec
MDWNEIQTWISKDFILELGRAVGIFLFVLLFGYILGDRIVPKLSELFFQNKLQHSHPLYKAGRRNVRLLFFLFGTFLFLKFLKLPSASEEFVLLSYRILSIILLTFSFVHLFSTGLKAYSEKTEGLISSASIINNVIRIVLFAVGVLLILQSLGIPIAPILGALGVGGLAVALGLQPTFSNLFSGLNILFGKQLKKGDYVRLQGEGMEGHVQDITWRSTKIRRFNNSTIVVPNSVMASSVFTHFDLPTKELSIQIEAGVAYQTDLEKVESMAVDIGNEVLKKFYGSSSTKEVSFSYQKFDKNSVNFKIDLPYHEFTDQFPIQHEFIKLLYSRFQKEGIELRL